MGKTLHLTLKKKWFDMIASGEKKEEYREIKDYWVNRLFYDFGHIWDEDGQVFEYTPNEFETVSARNGYGAHRPVVCWEHKGIRIGVPNPAWCEPEDMRKTVIILDIGEIRE
jgi:hypothetical protein